MHFETFDKNKIISKHDKKFTFDHTIINLRLPFLQKYLKKVFFVFSKIKNITTDSNDRLFIKF